MLTALQEKSLLVPDLYSLGKNDVEQTTGRVVNERIWNALQTLFDDDGTKIVWLSKPNWHLGDLTPIAAINDGHAEIVAEMLEERLKGQPS